MQSVGSVGTRPQFNINEPVPVPIRGKTGDGAPSTFTYGPGQGYVPNPPVSVPTSDSEVSPEHFGDGSFGAPTYGPGQDIHINQQKLLLILLNLKIRNN